MDRVGGRVARGSKGVSSPGRDGRGGCGGHFNLPFLIVLVVVVLLLAAIIVLVVGRCSAGDAATAEASSQSQVESASESAAVSSSGPASTQAGTASSSEEPIDKAALLAVVDEDVADKLIKRAAGSDDALWIAQNPGQFAQDGEAVQRKLLKLAADEPAAQSYVRNFPDKYPMETPESGQVKTVATGKGIPRFYQWDGLWGYTVYSGTAFGLTGCGPTCLAMVYQGVTGNTDLSPYDMGVLATRGGYASDSEGTYSNFFTEGAASLNLPETTIDVTEKALKNALQSGQVVVANFAPGQFTEYGHFVVITGMNQDGTLVMNDPYSEERSNKSWGIETIVNESQAFYAYG